MSLQIRSTKRQRLPYLTNRPSNSWLVGSAMITLVLGASGLLLLRTGNAATYSAGSEAETGTLAGKYTEVSSTGTSGGKAVKFGTSATTIEAPYVVQALTGGNSIAVVWSPTPRLTIPTQITGYEVYRNDIKVATVTPGTGPTQMDVNGRSYIDTDVTKGASYTYKVRALAYNGSISPFKSTATVTHPTSTTPIPNFTFDTSDDGSDLSNYFNTVIKPYLQTWYPKVSDAIAYPSYTPANDIVIRTDQTAPLAQADPKNSKIRINPDWVRSKPLDAPGALLHEATHVIQNYPDGNGPAAGIAIEGIADWSRDWFTLERIKYPNPEAVASIAYSESAGMLQWGHTKYSPGLVRKVNVALHNGSDSLNNILVNSTGRTTDQLYDEYKSQYYSSIGPVVSLGNKCVEIAGNTVTNGALMQLAACNPSTISQRWSIIFQDAGLFGTTRTRGALVNGLLGAYKCYDVKEYGTVDGTPVQSWGCNYGMAQTWIFKPNGTIVNPNSGSCLSTTYDGSENGNKLIIRNCTVSPGQIWAWPK